MKKIYQPQIIYVQQIYSFREKDCIKNIRCDRCDGHDEGACKRLREDIAYREQLRKGKIMIGDVNVFDEGRV